MILDLLHNLPAAAVAEDSEVLAFVDRRRLHGKGIGYVDAHLLASVSLMPGTTIWTRDKRLHAAAHSLKIAFAEAAPH